MPEGKRAACWLVNGVAGRTGGGRAAAPFVVGVGAVPISPIIGSSTMPCHCRSAYSARRFAPFVYGSSDGVGDAVPDMGSARRARTNTGAGVGLGTKQAALDGRCGMRAEWEGTGTHHRLSAHPPRPAPPRPRLRSHLEPCQERPRKRGQWERRRDASRAASARCDGSMASGGGETRCEDAPVPEATPAES